MSKLTRPSRNGHDNAGAALPPTAEQVSLLARALEASGLGPDFARWQRQDTEVWAAVADEMDRQSADGAP
jgi:hypothetical protein